MTSYKDVNKWHIIPLLGVLILAGVQMFYSVKFIYYQETASLPHPQVSVTAHNGTKFEKKSCVVLTQVHDRVANLRLWIESLSRVQNISKCLLIFSQDVAHPEIRAVIKSITFSQVLEIFYPNPFQHSNNNCHPNNSLLERERKCENGSNVFQNQANVALTKLHWWWKAHLVFDHLLPSFNYSGLVLFLEDDLYALPDLLTTLNLMEFAMVKNKCDGCDVLTLGNAHGDWEIEFNVTKGPFRTFSFSTSWTVRQNLGMAFNTTVWRKLKACEVTFCQFDDYNWDWTLSHMTFNCLLKPLKVLYLKQHRIFHIGTCGLHANASSCDPGPAAQLIENKIKTSFKLFPKNLTMMREQDQINYKNQTGWGGWNLTTHTPICLSIMRDHVNHQPLHVLTNS